MSSPAVEEHPFGKPPEFLPPHYPAPDSRRSGAEVRVDVVDLGKARQRARFIRMVPALYQRDPNFINPLWVERMSFLNTEKNLALQQIDVHAMLAYRGGLCVGRMTAHIDRAYDSYHDTRAGWFGFFECIDDPAVAHTLFDQGLDWLKANGASQVIGPCNFTTNHQIGCLIENFSRPAMVEMTYNPPYYQRLIESYGFGKAKDLHSYWIDVSKGLEDPKIARFKRVADKVSKRYSLTIRHAKLSEFEAEVERIFKMYNESWQKNWGFVPVSEAEFGVIAREFKTVVVEELVLIVEHEGKPVGFCITVPNVNENMPRDGKLFPFGWYALATRLKKTKTARLVTLGVLPGYRKRGVEALLCLETALRANALGMSAGEIGWTLEDNHLVNSSAESLGAKLDRKYRLFGLEL